MRQIPGRSARAALAVLVGASLVLAVGEANAQKKKEGVQFEIGAFGGAHLFNVASLTTYPDGTARWQGDTVVLPETGADAAMILAERLRSAIADQKLSTSVGDLAVTASFGVSSSLPDAFVTPDALVGAADIALYRSKANGRNCATAFRG